jgi:hypothetical protein
MRASHGRHHADTIERFDKLAKRAAYAARFSLVRSE